MARNEPFRAIAQRTRPHLGSAREPFAYRIFALPSAGSPHGQQWG